MNKDILLYETGNGGDIAIISNDISLVETLYQQVYLRLFGGNVEANTTGNEIEGEQRFDWWANMLLLNDNKNKQFNSNTERVLDKVVLNSSGRINLKRAIELDLKDLQELADITINIVILSHNRVEVNISLQKPDISEDKILQFIWDNLRKEVIINQQI